MSADNEVLLPSGAIAIRQPLKGKDYFQFQGLAAKAVGKGASPTAMSEANQWLMLRAYKLAAPIEEVTKKAAGKTDADLIQPLTLDMLEDMSFTDVSVLNNDMTEHFLQPAQPANNSSPPAK